MTYIPPLRLEILRRLTDCLKSVTVENGYQLDLSDEAASGRKRVQRGTLFLGDDDPDILVTILEPPVAVEQIPGAPTNPTRVNEWDVLVQGWAKDPSRTDVNGADLEPCDLAYILAADVQKALGQEIEKRKTGRPGAPNYLGLGERITNMRIGAPVARPTEEVTGYGVFYLILTFNLVEDMANPFGYIANQPNGD